MCIFCERALSQLADGITPSQKRAAEACDVLREKRVRATIITGFLGAGKTTFLNFVLQSNAHKQRIGVVQNEFGSVPVDDLLMPVEKSAEEVVVMANGCLCCQVRGDLVDALKRLAERGTLANSVEQKLDGLIIECSGLSEVMPVAQTFFADPYVQAAFQLDGVICVADAANFEAQDSGTYGQTVDSGGDDVSRLLRAQLSISDVCLLNKCDLVDSARRDRIGNRIRTVSPGIKVVPCRNGKVNLGQVLRVNSFTLDSAVSLDAHFLQSSQPVGHGSSGHGDSHDSAHGSSSDVDPAASHTHTNFGSIGLEVDGEICPDALRTFLRTVVETHGDSLVRIKGVLRIAGGRVIVQGVGGHIDISEPDVSTPLTGPSRLVFIGRLNWELSTMLRTGFLGTALNASTSSPAS